MYRDMTIGAIYIRDRDETQGALLMNLQQNLRTISLVLAVIALTVSALFSRVLTARIRALLGAIRVVGEGSTATAFSRREGRTGPPGRRSSTSSLTAFRPPRRSAAALSPTPPMSSRPLWPPSACWPTPSFRARRWTGRLCGTSSPTSGRRPTA
ncbi:MAG: hypothetical protein ACLRWQ_03080 [Flavonifractor plautii]